MSGRLLPKGDTGERIRDLSRHAETLATQYAIERFAHLRIGTDSTLVGRPRDQLDLSREPGLNVLTIVDGRTGRPTSSGHFVVGDRLTMTGRRGDVEAYALDQGLSVGGHAQPRAGHRSPDRPRPRHRRGRGPPRSRMIGEEVRPGHVTATGWVVLAVQRQGLDRGSATTMLQVGDTLLVEGRWEVLDASTDDAEVLVVDAPDLVRRQSAPLAVARCGRSWCCW